MIADTKHIKKQAWQTVAQQQGFSQPSDHQLTLIMDMRLERAITEVTSQSALCLAQKLSLAQLILLRLLCMLSLLSKADRGLSLQKAKALRLYTALQVLRWTRDWGKAKQLAWQVAAAYASGFNALTEPQPGIRKWLHALSKANVPCTIVTAFDR